MPTVSWAYCLHYTYWWKLCFVHCRSYVAFFAQTTIQSWPTLAAEVVSGGLLLVGGEETEWRQRWLTGCGAGVRAKRHVAARQWPGSLASSVSRVFSLLGHPASSLALSMICSFAVYCVFLFSLLSSTFQYRDLHGVQQDTSQIERNYFILRCSQKE